MSNLTKRLPVDLPPAPTNVPIVDYRLADIQSVLAWTVVPENGIRFPFDLRIFATGSAEEGLSARPELIEALAPVLRIKTNGKAQQTCVSYIASLKHFWRYLDRQESAGLRRKGLMDIADADGLLLRTYLLHDLKLIAAARHTLYVVRDLVSQAQRRVDPERRELIWPRVSLPRPNHKDVDPAIIRPLYSLLKRHYYSLEQALEEGQALLAEGRDPRVIGNGEDREAWSTRENVAFLTNKIVGDALLGHPVKAVDYAPRFADPDNYDLPLLAPVGAVDAPAMFDRVRWFVPRSTDSACAFLLVLAQFGWNPEAVHNIDISRLERWCDERLHPTSEDGDATVAIYGYKGRTGKEQIGFSRTKPRHHPYRIILSMIRRTEPLRQHLRRERARLDRAGESDLKTERRKKHLDAAIASPWLYFSSKSMGIGGRVSVLSAKTLGNVLARIRQRAYEEAIKSALRSGKLDSRTGGTTTSARAEAHQRYGALLELTAGDLRDGFASYIYDASLADILVLKNALGHGSIGATQHYVRQRRQIAQRYGAFRSFQEVLWDEIKRPGRIDPTVIFIRTTVGQITDGQRQRLKDERLLTRMGMGCLDPISPPPEIAPDHPGGLCQVQRCVLCRHGVVFDESIPRLAERMAELRFIRTQVAQARWWGSSFEFEWIAIDAMLDLFADRQAEFETLVQEHLTELRAGRVYLFDQVPPSSIGTIA